MKFVALLLLLFAGTASAAGDIPRAADQYRRPLTREAQMQWGLRAPVARFAAQIHQESGWRADAKSAYAGGLAQFTPATADWIAKLYPRELGEGAPYSPTWALRALVTYDRWLYDRTRGATECDRWWFLLRAYNGGLGHVQAEARLTACPLHREVVDAACGLAKRAAAHCAENLGYPRRILLTIEPCYRTAGWPGEGACS